MKNRREDKGSEHPELSSAEFRDIVMEAIPSLGYSLGSIIVDGEHALKITASIPSKSVGNGVLIKVVREGKKTGLGEVRSFLEEIKSGSYFEGVFISAGGFTKSAVEYAKDKNVRLLPFSSLKDASSAKKIPAAEKTEEHKIYELVFKPYNTAIEGAKAYFEGKKSTKLLGFLGRDERIVDIQGRFAPIACFEVQPENRYEANPEKFKTYVNLNSGAIYFLRLGSAKSKTTIRSSPELQKLMRLSPESLRILAEINSVGEIEAQEISSENLSLIHENPNHMVALHTLGLIISPQNSSKVLSNLNLPPFSGRRYDLSKYFEIVKSFESDFPADEIKLAPRDIMAVLQGLLNASVSFKGVVYMLYFSCKYVDDRGVGRVELMLTPEEKKEASPI